MNSFLPDVPFEALQSADIERLLRGATGLFVAFTLIVTRLSGMVVSGPLFGHPDIPLQIRVFLVLALSFVITPALAGGDSLRTFDLLDHNRDALLTRDEIPGSLEREFDNLLRQAGKPADEGLTADEFRPALPLPETLWEYAWLAVVEFAVGVALGLGVTALMAGLQMAGSLIDGQIGVSMGSIFNPQLETDVSLSGEMLYQLGLVVFLIVGGHVLMISALVDTFRALPVGYAWVSPPAIELLSDLVRQSLALALQVSAPVMGVMAIVGLSMGFLGHTIPQLNVLVVGFPVRTLVGLLLFGLAVPGAAEAWAGIMPDVIAHLRQVLMGL